MKNTWLVILLILILQIVLRLPFLAEPFSYDETVYAQIAIRLGQGEVLYREIVDVKPPLIFFYYQALAGDPARVRLVTALLGLTATLLLFIIGRRLVDTRVGLAAAFFYALFSGGFFIEGAQANPENLMIVPLLLSFLAFLAGGWWLFIAGVFSGLAILIKQTALFNLLALLLLCVWRRDFKGAGRLVLGILVFPAVLLGFYFYQGRLNDLISAVIVLGAGMAQASLVIPLLQTLALALKENSVLWLLAFLGLLFAFGRRREIPMSNLLVWAFFSLAGTYSVGYALGHYFIPAIPALCLFAGLAVGKWPELSLTKKARAWLIALLTALGLLIVVCQAELYLVCPPDQLPLARYGDGAIAAAVTIGRGIGQASNPADQVFGHSPTVFYSGRKSLRKYFITPLGGHSEVSVFGRKLFARDFSLKRDPAAMRAIDADIYNALRDKRTKYYIVYLRGDYFPGDIKIILNREGYRFDPVLSDRAN
ncbi:MAG: glycosyltransferase family 39 protein, partial [Candidatus Margulisbacteria bacterium]|nr:glycosyltransferase family 39 protein [Candidatus Margulisiibacteriota bacterium]